MTWFDPPGSWAASGEQVAGPQGGRAANRARVHPLAVVFPVVTWLHGHLLADPGLVAHIEVVDAGQGWSEGCLNEESSISLLLCARRRLQTAMIFQARIPCKRESSFDALRPCPNFAACVDEFNAHASGGHAASLLALVDGGCRLDRVVAGIVVVSTSTAASHVVRTFDLGELELEAFGAACRP